MSAGEFCDPRFDDGVDYVCSKVVAQLEENRGKDPLRYRAPDGMEIFACEPCLIDMLNAREARRRARRREWEGEYEPPPF